MKATTVFIILLFVSGVGALFYTVSMPVIEIQINGEHNPITNEVSVNGKSLNPEGQGGLLYKTKVRPTGATINFSGPFVSEYQEEVSAGLFARKTIIIESSVRSTEDIIKEAVVGNSLVLNDIRVFKEAGAIVANIIVDGKAVEDSFPRIILYSSADKKWRDVSNEYVANRNAFKIDPEVTKYFGELASD
jgi:hypothetical protein